MGVSLAAAVVASVLMGSAAILQSLATRRAVGLLVLKHPLYVAGTVLDLIGWGLSVVAMRHLPLLAVQTILAASLAVTVILAARILRVKPSRSVWVAVIVVCLACGVVVVAAQPGPPAPAPAQFSLVLTFSLILLVAVAALSYRHPRTPVCAVVAGMGYSGAAVAARAIHGSSIDALLKEPLVWLIVGFAIVGAVMFSRALETRADAVNEASAWLWVIEIVVPSIVGVMALGDQVRPGWAIPTVVAMIAAIVATMRISTSNTLLEHLVSPQAS
ncbi:hypothetical protein E8P82_11430 [Arthrobacter echini]|uniref:Uncharacterized protein n=2 Tax=Arthrobacter echini TaxID=1529066 RepID=A0A5D0XIY4_9MICC|nr:hypothetical protein [Arthrobacter echini]THJ65590.1 hypothetical protein E8P82_11430 [Arthrobacter echini]TYC96450.1 hypothetical protein FQ377_13915 [Arthrobacter echini]